MDRGGGITAQSLPFPHAPTSGTLRFLVIGILNAGIIDTFSAGPHPRPLGPVPARPVAARRGRNCNGAPAIPVQLRRIHKNPERTVVRTRSAPAGPGQWMLAARDADRSATSGPLPRRPAGPGAGPDGSSDAGRTRQ